MDGDLHESGGDDMAYFSNGAEGLYYMENHCDKCRNWLVDPDFENNGIEIGCPIWDLHLIHNDDDEWKEILDFHIPRNEKGENEDCIWWKERKEISIRDWEQIEKMTLDDWKFKWEPPQIPIEELELFKATCCGNKNGG